MWIIQGWIVQGNDSMKLLCLPFFSYMFKNFSERKFQIIVNIFFNPQIHFENLKMDASGIIQ